MKLRPAPEVALYEPVRSLDGGADGLDAYREYPNFSANFITFGQGCIRNWPQQGDAVTVIFCAAGFVSIKTVRTSQAAIEVDFFQGLVVTAQGRKKNLGIRMIRTSVTG